MDRRSFVTSVLLSVGILTVTLGIANAQQPKDSFDGAKKRAEEEANRKAEEEAAAKRAEEKALAARDTLTGTTWGYEDGGWSDNTHNELATIEFLPGGRVKHTGTGWDTGRSKDGVVEAIRQFGAHRAE